MTKTRRGDALRGPMNPEERKAAISVKLDEAILLLGQVHSMIPSGRIRAKQLRDALKTRLEDLYAFRFDLGDWDPSEPHL